jgi:hypothetical protein
MPVGSVPDSRGFWYLKEDDVRRVGRLQLMTLLMCLSLTAAASAQFGHPLKGSWSGDWGTSKENRTRILVNLNWDGKEITGTINPGPNGVALQKATLNPETWTVRFEAEGKDPSGAVVRYVIEGKLENIGAYQRFMTGTWMQGSAKGDFKLTRN